MICPMTISKRKTRTCEEINFKHPCAWLVSNTSKDTFFCAMELNAIVQAKGAELNMSTFSIDGSGER